MKGKPYEIALILNEFATTAIDGVLRMKAGQLPSEKYINELYPNAEAECESSLKQIIADEFVERLKKAKVCTYNSKGEFVPQQIELIAQDYKGETK